jgi:hypothetical protein
MESLILKDDCIEFENQYGVLNQVNELKKQKVKKKKVEKYISLKLTIPRIQLNIRTFEDKIAKAKVCIKCDKIIPYGWKIHMDFCRKEIPKEIRYE